MNKVARVLIVTSNLSSASDMREKGMANLAKSILESCQAADLNVDLLNLDSDVPENFFQEVNNRDSIVIEYQIRFQRADLIIFIYPIKLGQVPSKIKYFLELILARGFSYNIMRNQIEGLFPDKAMWSIAITDLPAWKVNTVWGNGHTNWWKRIVREYSGSKIKTWILPNWRSISEDKIISWQVKFSKIITDLNNNQNLLELI